ncbi:c-type cytochrome [Azospirillum oryzae]|uniref:C-type cytochrome n=1 Tax=Azospirillum oryzae TaxID=286727 RepID=A0A6N1AHW4_9PROT|nr:c-type cytochrome [Azospirillum oryzae]QKS50819.1 c-type cytochrome [Azospirillum oryzae]GLR82267.1 cytochrome c [Azospirillum oryzae]
MVVKKALKVGIGLALAAVVALAGAVMFAGPKVSADPTDAAQVARGKMVYAEQCASCHGTRLEGQTNWQSRKADGRLPAPPHDATGHTWHHPDEDLFRITKQGIAAFAPPGYSSDMPAFGGKLSDADIWAVLAFIKSSWPEDIRRRHAAMSEQSKK